MNKPVSMSEIIKQMLENSDWYVQTHHGKRELDSPFLKLFFKEILVPEELYWAMKWSERKLQILK